ncbi:GIY-YIG nuclease family protein [Chryseobacterium cucumeris]|uniref:GIY-YIG nuclease family protein n=1 Tax=Chryseobacterium cucumeris TaxID=1813611 RepID=A0ABX9X6G4_9FLAO|nr:GIY-YIG nuclease family protein [Chryseobacterium cucumeris]ROH90707.1 GIY-YIG nuclease family protein [Chryseobacterium cucumeris]
MNIFGKTIRLFFVDGTPNSLTTAELSNWTGIGVRVPRIKVREFSNRTEFRKPGVYLLIGKGDNNEDAAYIGEAEVIADRLISHIANKEFWNEVLFFGSKDQYLNKAGIKYLENRLYELAIHAERYTINQNIPTRPELSEAEQAELEEFLSNVKILTASLGHKIFESLEETVEQNETNQLILFCKNGAGANAKGSPSTEGFVVYKDSLMMETEQPSLNEGIILERNKMISDGILLLENGFYKLTKDYIFNSPSRAAAAILARSASGPIEWKTEEGVQLKYLEI